MQPPHACGSFSARATDHRPIRMVAKQQRQQQASEPKASCTAPSCLFRPLPTLRVSVCVCVCVGLQLRRPALTSCRHLHHLFSARSVSLGKYEKFLTTIKREREREREKIKYQSLAGIPSARSAIVLTLLGRVVKSFAESEKCLPSSGVWSAQVLEYFWTTETFPAPATIDRDNNKNCACSRKTAVGAATISGTLLCGLVSLESSVPFSGRCGLHPHTQPAGPGCLFETFAPFQHG